MRVLVVNAGSSSIKLSLLDDADQTIVARDVTGRDTSDMGGQLEAFLRLAPAFDAAGHRIVHGGDVFTRPVLLDGRRQHELDALAELAPLQNPPSLSAVHALRALRPDLPQVACFDTAFHASMPARASTYAVPGDWRRRWALRRYGFHGLSHAWATRRAAALLGVAPGQLRLVSAHIGAGASLAAVAFGRSVDTTMGFTPMEGLVMATRSGSVDPGILLWVQRHGGLSTDDLEEALDRRSGLLGLSGVSGDLRDVLAAGDRGEADAQLAYEVYTYRIQTAVAAMTAALRGLDALAFTGGAGEASDRLRADVCTGLEFLGLRLDAQRNRAVTGDTVVSTEGVRPAVLVVRAREDLEIARHVRELLG